MRFSKQDSQEQNRFLHQESNLSFERKDKKSKLRSVPPMLISRIFFSDVRAVIGIVFTSVGGIFVLVFGSLMLESRTTGVADDDPTAAGIILNIEGTGTTVNDNRVYMYHYKFEIPQHGLVKGKTKAYYGMGEVGDSVMIQYNPSNPEKSQFADQTESIFPAWIMLFILIFPIIGIIFVIVSISKTKRTVAVLRTGETAWGTFAGEEPTNTTINNQRVYRLFFKFTAADGKEYTATGTTHLTFRLKDEDRELVVYDPQNPNEAFPVDAFPAAVKHFLIEK